MNTSIRQVLNLTEWDLNNDPLYRLPNVSFRLSWQDSNGTLAGTVGGAIKLANEGAVGLIGEFSSFRTGPAALAMNTYRYVWIGVAAAETVYEQAYGETYSLYTNEDRQNLDGLQLCTLHERGGEEWESLNARFFQLYNQFPAPNSYSYRDCALAMYYGFKRMLANGFPTSAILNRSSNISLGGFLSTFNGSTGSVAFDVNGDRIK
ncbi:hypothetical protein HDU96_003095 [Phlyctochytrium bullatum]|nr:hypothetical protein HDU96_003095 [Phlyctochytrium bullatum]